METVAKNIHEIRDPIHVFVRLDNDERKVLNSRCFQRLRHIHQLALTYLVYPGATHKRFEHSLGVMELAARVYDIVTNPVNVTDEICSRLEPLTNDHQKDYWRRVLRMAALCHDVGHLPFSHAAEKELLPECWDHERITREIIISDEMKSIWCEVTPPLRALDIVKLAVGPNKARDLQFTDWEIVLSEIIVGDAFGIDRMDYLLRDSYHVGVAYGRFDHYRLIDTLRILAMPDDQMGRSAGSGGGAPALGIEEGGLESAEALLLARYFMYSQVYFHPVRRIYDIHLMDFLKEWLSKGVFSTKIRDHFNMTDNEITAALLKAAFDDDQSGHLHAGRVVRREHFKAIYQRSAEDVQINPDSGSAVFQGLCDELGPDHFRHDQFHERDREHDFPVHRRDGEIVSSLSMSNILKRVPVVSVDVVFAARQIFDTAKDWLDRNKREIIKLAGGENDE